jgi:hypothetical protein
MNIQRWTDADGDFGAEMWADAGGDYVLFADHQQALSALEARISELEKALKTLIAACIRTNGLLTAPTVEAEQIARAVLSATDPYTNTKGYIGPQ